MDSSVTSRDGTLIAYTRRGDGPPVILVGGGLDDGSENEPLAESLARDFTTYNYARRGRGPSGDTSPYAVARELEDLEALLHEAAGHARLVGVSSGAMYALEAALAGLPVDRLALYEVPYDTARGSEERATEYRRELDRLLLEDRLGDALALFMQLAGASEDDIERARSSDSWPPSEALAHTLGYDAHLYGPPPVERLAAIRQPTMVVTGGGAPFYESAADAIAAAITGATRARLDGQAHVVDPDVLAATLRPFFLERPTGN